MYKFNSFFKKSKLTIIGLFVFLFGCPTIPLEPPQISSDESFTMAIMSDPQLFWYGRSSTNDDPCSSTQSVGQIFANAGTCVAGDNESVAQCNRRCAIESVEDQVKSVNLIDTLKWPNEQAVTYRNGASIGAAKAAIINGDLTEYWHPEQKQFYEGYFRYDSSEIPTIPVYVGLGNHDYHNNVCDCYGYAPFDGNSCASDAVGVTNTIYSNVKGVTFDKCSLAYLYEIGDIVFVQMHLSPAYSVDVNVGVPCPNPADDTIRAKQMFQVTEAQCNSDNPNYVGQSFPWLETQLNNATLSGKYIVLNMHAPVDNYYWGLTAAEQMNNKDKFKQILNKNNVSAIFGGHLHPQYGHMGDYKIAGSSVLNKKGKPIPLFRSGAAEYYTYLLAEFGVNQGLHYMNVGVVSSRHKSLQFTDGMRWNGTTLVADAKAKTFLLD